MESEISFGELLRRFRKYNDYTQAETAQRLGYSEETIKSWEQGRRFPAREEVARLANLMEMDAQGVKRAIQVGRGQAQIQKISGLLCEYFSNSQLGNSLSIALKSEVQASELGAIMAILFDPSKRKVLQYILAAAGMAVVSPQEALQELLRVEKKPLLLNEQILSDLEQLGDVCWRLSNNSQLEIVEQLLPAYLSKVTALAHHPSNYQRRIATLATKGHVLAAEVDKSSIIAMQAHCQQALFYSEIAGDPNVKVGALRQEATIALVAKQPLKSLQTYQQTLPLLGSVSPLLHSRIYLGLASANARLYKQSGDFFYKRDAWKYLTLAQEHFPTWPESDPNFLYTLCNESVLRLYEALTYNDLRQPDDAWQSLMRVDGLQPKIAVTESARIEFINLQAQTAAALGNMEQSCFYVQASVDAADAAGYSIWREEAAEVYQELAQIWPHELQVRNLGRLFRG